MFQVPNLLNVINRKYVLPIVERKKDHSCFALRRKESNQLELEMTSVSCYEPRLYIFIAVSTVYAHIFCKNNWHHRPYVCEFHGPGHPFVRPTSAYGMNTFLLGYTIVDIYVKLPVNSFSSCLAFCQGKGAKTMVMRKPTCLCLAGIKENLTTVLVHPASQIPKFP